MMVNRHALLGRAYPAVKPSHASHHCPYWYPLTSSIDINSAFAVGWVVAMIGYDLLWLDHGH